MDINTSRGVYPLLVRLRMRQKFHIHWIWGVWWVCFLKMNMR